ncbi:MAG: regulator of sigma E protease, partial [Kiritimatiellia bacterium]
RLLVMLAGPVANLVLPAVVFTGIYLVGLPEIESIVHGVDYEGVAWQAGLRPEDRVVSVNGTPVRFWKELEWALVDAGTGKAELQVARGDSTLQVVIPENSLQSLSNGLMRWDSVGMRAEQASSQVGVDDPDSPASKAGLRTFDVVTEVDGQDVRSFVDLTTALSAPGSHKMTVLRPPTTEDEKVETLELTMGAEAWTGRPDDRLATRWGIVRADVFTSTIVKGGAAEAAGIERGDRLFTVDGVEVRDFGHLRFLVSRTAIVGDGVDVTTRALTLKVLRRGELVERTFTPGLDKVVTVHGTYNKPLIGVGQGRSAIMYDREVVRRGPIEAASLGLSMTWRSAMDVLGALDSLVRNKNAVKDSVGGPVKIVTVTGQSFAAGPLPFLMIVSQISVSLAIVNLLPVPALDGGQIVVFGLEWIRGRPLAPEIRMRIQMVGVLILFAVIVLVTVLDVSSLFPSGV